MPVARRKGWFRCSPRPRAGRRVDFAQRRCDPVPRNAAEAVRSGARLRRCRSTAADGRGRFIAGRAFLHFRESSAEASQDGLARHGAARGNIRIRPFESVEPLPGRRGLFRIIHTAKLRLFGSRSYLFDVLERHRQATARMHRARANHPTPAAPSTPAPESDAPWGPPARGRTPASRRGRPRLRLAPPRRSTPPCPARAR